MKFLVCATTHRYSKFIGQPSMKPPIPLIVCFLLLALSCHKPNDSPRFHGKVISQPNHCTSGTGYPFIIECTNSLNILDSFITATLPAEFKILGQRIQFDVREPRDGDEYIVCTGPYIIPHQFVIYNVSNQ